MPLHPNGYSRGGLFTLTSLYLTADKFPRKSKQCRTFFTRSQFKSILSLCEEMAMTYPKNYYLNLLYIRIYLSHIQEVRNVTRIVPGWYMKNNGYLLPAWKDKSLWTKSWLPCDQWKNSRLHFTSLSEVKSWPQMSNPFAIARTYIGMYTYIHIHFSKWWQRLFQTWSNNLSGMTGKLPNAGC